MSADEYLDSALNMIYTDYVVDENGQYKNNFSVETFRKSFNRKTVNDYTSSGIEEPIPTIGEIEARELLEKLSNDGYLRHAQENQTGRQLPGVFFTTFEGRWFMEQGGYVEKLKALAAEKRKTDFYEQETYQNAISLKRLTILIAIGTIIAAIYYCVATAKEFPCFWASYRIAFLVVLCAAIASIIVWLLIAQVRQANKQK